MKHLDKELSKRFGFEKVFGVSGQTYDRKIDAKVLALLSNIAQSAHKFTNDLRLLQNLKEIGRTFEKIKSVHLRWLYKRNPICVLERISALAKYVMSLQNSSAMVDITQWFERTLDDSANKRLTIPRVLAVDAILLIWNNISEWNRSV